MNFNEIFGEKVKVTTKQNFTLSSDSMIFKIYS